MLKNRSIPFGYCVVNGKYTISENEAEAVRKIFADYIGGKTLIPIAAEMTIPYNTGKSTWNKNMVCRVPIISVEDFKQAACIKAERNTYRKPAPQNDPRQAEVTITEYEPTDEIQRMSNEINRLLDSEIPDKEKAEALIINCAKLEYATIREVKLQ